MSKSARELVGSPQLLGRLLSKKSSCFDYLRQGSYICLEDRARLKARRCRTRKPISMVQAS